MTFLSILRRRPPSRNGKVKPSREINRHFSSERGRRLAAELCDEIVNAELPTNYDECFDAIVTTVIGEHCNRTNAIDSANIYAETKAKIERRTKNNRYQIIIAEN